MKSNSNFNITKVTVDPVSQEITNLEINGKAVETGGSELEEKVYDVGSPLNVERLFAGEPSPLQISPSSGYDGLEMVTIQPGGLTGYPGEGLEIIDNPSAMADIPSEISINIPEGKAWTGTITLYSSNIVP